MYPDGAVKELGESRSETTNNRMELLGALKGLQSLAISSVSGEPLKVWMLTDSTYVIRGITEWIFGWMKRGWRNSQNEPVKNQDLWQALFEEVRSKEKSHTLKLEWKYLRGHSGTPGNERCDEIAVAMSKGKWIDLYQGSVLQYPVAIYDLPEDLSLPKAQIKNKAQPSEPVGYLSFVNGQLRRHRTWKECESAVKGRPGARFKKALSEQHVDEILQQWNLTRSDWEK